ncbi:MAG: ParB N-terminal domain-containing protein [bacterium]|nr:ParB N-terminal domain-containing protein [bacterium]
MTKKVWKGSRDLRRWLTPIEGIVTNPRNARLHTQRDVDATARSLDEHGQQKPIVVKPGGMLLVGEGRLLAARSLGWTHLSAVVTDIDEENERTLYMIRDNRLAELSSWHLERLSRELQALKRDHGLALEETGLWEPSELSALIEADWEMKERKDREAAERGAPLMLTTGEREVVDRAVAKMREELGDEKQEHSEGAVIGAICRVFVVEARNQDEMEGEPGSEGAAGGDQAGPPE